MIRKEIFSKFIYEILIGTKACFMDSNNILYRCINNEVIGKRSVWTYDFRACWIEDTELDNIKSYWCGKDADYNEVFKMKKP